MNSMNIAKLVGALAAALLFLLVGASVAGKLYQVDEPVAHVAEGEEAHETPKGFVIAAGDEGGAEEEAVVEVSFEELLAAADAGKGEKVFGKCKACHTTEAGKNMTGPSLHAVVGRTMATEAGFGYSDALIALQGGTWTPQELQAYLHDPKSYAPGNKMTFAGLKKDEDIANLIAWLETQ